MYPDFPNLDELLWSTTIVKYSLRSFEKFHKLFRFCDQSNSEFEMKFKIVSSPGRLTP
jgi:hypothetical protein